MLTALMNILIGMARSSKRDPTNNPSIRLRARPQLKRRRTCQRNILLDPSREDPQAIQFLGVDVDAQATRRSAFIPNGFRQVLFKSGLVD